MSITKKRILITTVLLIFFVIFLKPKHLSFFIVGFFFVLVGVLFRLISSACIRKNKILSTKGPYSLCRNPLYLGSFMIFIGLLIQVSSLNFKTLILWVSYLLILIYIYSNQIKTEEKELLKRFGDEYLEYKKNTPCIIPNISCFVELFDLKNYNFQSFIKNREYKTLVLIVAIEVFLYLRIDK